MAHTFNGCSVYLPSLHATAATFSFAVPPETDYAPSTHPSLWPPPVLAQKYRESCQIGRDTAEKKCIVTIYLICIIFVALV